MYKKINILFAVMTLFVFSCTSVKHISTDESRYNQLSAEDRKLADTLIKKTLENEGLFTVLSGLKPISSVTDLYLQIAQKDSSQSGTKNITDTTSADFLKLRQYHRVLSTLQSEDVGFIMSPFKMYGKGKRVMQITVYRKSLVDSLIAANQTFFGQYGFLPGTRPELVLNTTEYENKYDRFRSYGYLFGYPEHAVTFFVDAARRSDSTKKFVERDFFQIPVYSEKKGRFVYAIPKERKPGETDSLIYKRAAYYLEVFQKIRPQYVRKDGSVDYKSLWNKLLVTTHGL